MGIRYLKSVTPGSRFASRSDFTELTTDTPSQAAYTCFEKKWWSQ